MRADQSAVTVVFVSRIKMDEPRPRAFGEALARRAASFRGLTEHISPNTTRILRVERRAPA